MKEKNHDIVLGLVCGAGMCCWVLIEYALGFHTTALEIGQYTGFVAFIFPAIFIFIAMYDRQKQMQISLPFVEGINRGFRIALFSSLVLTFFFHIYNTYINPEWIELMIEWQRKKMILAGASDDEIGRFMEQNRQMNSSFAQLITGFISATGVGVLITLLEFPLVKLLHTKQH